MISIKSKRELQIMHEGGEILASILDELKKFVKPNLRTIEIDRKASALIKEKGALSAFKGYRGFPGHVCISINEEVVHGIPSEKRLKEGDIVSVDAGVIYQGYYADAARTWPVGQVSPEAKKLIEVARDALRVVAMGKLRAGARLGDVSHAIQEFVESKGFSVVRDFVGHGIGRELHEEPQVPNFGEEGQGIKLEPGMVLAIEPMVTAGHHDVMLLNDGWTVVTEDGHLASHFEDTIAITQNGPEILTLSEF